MEFDCKYINPKYNDEQALEIIKKGESKITFVESNDKKKEVKQNESNE